MMHLHDRLVIVFHFSFVILSLKYEHYPTIHSKRNWQMTTAWKKWGKWGKLKNLAYSRRNYATNKQAHEKTE